jgi:hypothetical protein
VSDIPVTPDAETARQWAADELAKAAYQPHSDSPPEKAQSWIADFLNSLDNLWSGLGAGGAALAILVIALVVAAVVFAVVGPMRRARRRAREHLVFEDDTRDAATMRASAEQAAERGLWRLAVLERYRGVIRSLEERDLIPERPGMTAHEAAEQTARRFPDVRHLVGYCSDVFDGVRYGHSEATSEDYDKMVSLDRALIDRSILTAATL